MTLQWNRSSILTAVIALSLLPACQSTRQASAPKLLKFGLEADKGYDYETAVSMDQELFGQTVSVDMTTYFSMRVEGDAGSLRKIRASIDRFRLKTSVAGMSLDVDTDAPAGKQDTSGTFGDQMQKLQRIFSAIRGQGFSMLVNEEGKIMSVTGMDDMAERIADSLRLGQNERESVMKEFRQQFNASEVRQNLEQFWYIFPNKEVNVGDSWEKTREGGGKVPVRYRSRYEVLEIEGDMVTIEEKTRLEPKDRDFDRLEGTVTGTLVVDSRNGLVVRADQDLNMSASGSGLTFSMKGKVRVKGTAR